MKMHSEGWDVNASLEKSAVYGYRGVFEVQKINVEKSQEKDPALVKIERDRAKATPMPESVRTLVKKLVRT